MTISARLLRKWRKEALCWEMERPVVKEPRSELMRKILRMTGELLDQQLLAQPPLKKKEEKVTKELLKREVERKD